MKWAKLTKEVDTRYPRDRSIFRECGGNSTSHKDGFDDLKRQLSDAGEPPLGEWISFTLAGNFNLPDRERFEHFVCGYLYHYDHSQQPEQDHTIYFKWEPFAGLKKKVTIYLSPEAINVSPLVKDPPAPPAPPPPPMS